MGCDKELVQAVIAHRETEKLPYYFDFTPPARYLVEQHYGSPIEEVLAYPIRMKSCNSIKPLYADPSVYGEMAKDEFGVTWKTSTKDRGVPLIPCLPEPDLSRYRFPDPSSPYRFEGLDTWCQENRSHYLILWVGDLWERATFMRGLQKILLDTVLNRTFVEELLEKISEYILRTLSILLKRYKFDAIAVSDDYGTQKGMLISPDDWRKLVKPRLAKIYQTAKSHGKQVLHHSDGNILPIIGDLIDIGLDILHPVQPEAMDILQVKREFGKHLTFFGGIRTQDILVRASPDEVRNHVLWLKRQMGKNGGYIISNGITIQADVPLANICAMIDGARE